MKQLLTLFLLTSVTFKLLATAQFPDKIIYYGKTYSLQSNPLEDFFEKYPDKRPKSEMVSTALWRGYIATFEIRANQLFVIDIEIEALKDTLKNDYQTYWRSVIKEVFPDQKDVKIDWFTGLLVIPYGKMVNYVHMGYGSTFKKYILLEIEAGNLNKEARFNYKEYEKFKEKQFLEFKKTDKYKQMVNDLKKENDNVEFIDSFLRDFIIEYTSKIMIDN